MEGKVGEAIVDGDRHWRDDAMALRECAAVHDHKVDGGLGIGGSGSGGGRECRWGNNRGRWWWHEQHHWSVWNRRQHGWVTVRRQLREGG